mmetsp:Transcript_6894/g.9124  ORF Transcript_6894/g.9124 Transcript_6894/m.9124 type:complete len:175 (-) Transcript_6894:36-560(-)
MTQTNKIQKQRISYDGISLGDYDVVCGRRHKFSQDHIGNRRFHVMINSHKKKYREADTKDDKSRVAYKIIDHVKRCKGRFLFFETKSKSWHEAGDDRARSFITKTLREANARLITLHRRDEKEDTSIKDSETPIIRSSEMSNLLEMQRRIFMEMLESDEEGSEHAQQCREILQL